MKNNNKSIWALSLGLGGVILVFLVWFIYFRTQAQTEVNLTFLPAVNAILNTLTSILLILGFRAIRKGHKEKHIRLMISAGLTSAIFLVGYLLYHYFHGDTRFIGFGIKKYAYFFILITHIILSIVQVPLILATFSFAALGKFSAHKKIARITFPVWLYVSVTGVLVFLFLKFLNY